MGIMKAPHRVFTGIKGTPTQEVFGQETNNTYVASLGKIYINSLYKVGPW